MTDLSAQSSVAASVPSDGRLPVMLLPWGPQAAEFREGWLAGREPAGAPDYEGRAAECPFPPGSTQSAAWHAARAYAKELGL